MSAQSNTNMTYERWYYILLRNYPGMLDLIIAISEYSHIDSYDIYREYYPGANQGIITTKFKIISGINPPKCSVTANIKELKIYIHSLFRYLLYVFNTIHSLTRYIILTYNSNSKPASSKVIEKLELIHNPSDSLCSICQNEWNTEQGAWKMPTCIHCFHKDCIIQWWKTHNTCPLCRAEVETDTKHMHNIYVRIVYVNRH